MDIAYDAFRYLYGLIGNPKPTPQSPDPPVGTTRQLEDISIDTEVLYDRQSDHTGSPGTPPGQDGHPSVIPPSIALPLSLVQLNADEVGLQTALLEEDEMEKQVSFAIQSVQDGSFDEFRARNFAKDVTSVIQASANKMKETERFSKLTCARLNRLFVLERCGHVLHGLHFFYTGLLLTDDLVVCVLSDEDSTVMRSLDHLVLENSLWTRVFARTHLTPFRYQELLDLLQLFGEMVKRNYNLNPNVCYYIGLRVLTAYQKMRIGENLYSEMTKELVLIMVKCCIEKGRYDLAEKDAKIAAEKFVRPENPESLELWSKCCQMRGNLRLAIQVAERAVDCSYGLDRMRLQQHLAILSSQVSHRNSEISREWLVGDNILHNNLQSQREKVERMQRDHRKKKRNKTKAVPKTRERPRIEDSDERTASSILNGALSKRNMPIGLDAFQTIPHQRLGIPGRTRTRNEEVMIEVDHWENASEDHNEESNLSDSEESEEEYYSDDETDEQAEAHNLEDSEDEKPTKTWFEESQHLYRGGNEEDKLIVGEGLDIVFYPKVQQMGSVSRYKPLEPPHVLERLLNTQPDKYKRCRIELDGPHKAVCRVLETGQIHNRIEIHGRSKCGQTFNNDEVLVEIIDQNTTIRQDSDKVFGRVVGVFNSQFRETEFPLLACTNNPKEVDVMHPMCKSVPKLYVWNGRTKENCKNHKYRIDVYKIDNNGKLQFDTYFDILPSKRGQYVFLVVFLTWQPNCTYPKGAVLKVLDRGTKFSSGLQVLLNQFKVPTYYTKATVAHVEELLKKEENRRPEGNTDLTVFTIDPPQSKDLDDALSIAKEGDNFKVGVHIADVSLFVKKGDAVDKEAKKRATSFYPSSDWRTHNMLPEPLSQDKLSLLPNQYRHVISVFFVINENGETIGEPSVERRVIISRHQFSYREAQLIIDGKTEEVDCPQDFKDNIQHLHQLAQIIRRKRLKNSRFAVQFHDPRFHDTEDSHVDEEAHALVEEFMIKANHFIASWLMNSHRACIPLRCQAAPPQEELDQWIKDEGQAVDMLIQLQDKTIQNKKIEASKHCTTRNDQRTAYIPVQKSVWKQILEATQQGNVTSLRRLLCCDELHPLQCLASSHWLGILQSALYKCSADGSDQDLMHFMLDIQPYTHFTSPIRRYIDIVVHRLIHAVLDGKPPPHSMEEVHEICLNVSDAIKRQRRFDRGCRNIRQAEKLLRQPMVFDAVVDTVSDRGAVLRIPSLQTLSQRSREIAFNLLDFCCKPMEKEHSFSHKNEVLGSWNKRIYQFEDLHIRRKRENEQSAKGDPAEVSINVNMHTVHVQVSDFCKLLKAVLEGSNDMNQTAKCLSTKGERCYLTDRTGVRRVTSGGCGDSQINHHCRFNLTFSPGQVLRVQMHAAADQGILSPYVQLFQVCDNLNLCLSHVHDPVDTYAKYVTASIRERTFKKVAEYREAWLPIVEMETALSSVSSEETLLVYDVSTQLRARSSAVLGTFSFDAHFCDVRKIIIDGKSTDRLDEMNKGESAFDKWQTQRSLDYLCIRYTPQEYHRGDGIFRESSVWIGHAIIKKIKKRLKSESDDEDDEVVVTFQLLSNSMPPPQTLFSEKFTAVVEIIFKSEVDRRTEQMLTRLKDGDNLAAQIALHTTIPRLGPVRLQMCMRSPTDIQRGELIVSGYMPPNNASQTEAIANALVERFSLIQGPPGTGKTNTGLKLVYLFNKINKTMHSTGYDTEQRQVLFCGPSNKSVDLVARNLMTKLGDKCPKIVRMYGNTIECKDFPVPKRDTISKRSMRDLKSDEELRSVTLHYVIRQKGKPHAEEINNYDTMFRKYFKNQTKVNIDLDTIKKYIRLIGKAEQEELKICDVILCTCAVAGNPKLSEVARISQCIIDESAMCPEPQSMIPVVAHKLDQVVLLGDHKQLRPIVQCTQAAELGLDQSLFERYKEDRSFLNKQYRMHPRICEFPSRQFYDGKLQTGPDRAEDARWYIPPRRELSIWPVRTNPKVFCHVEGVEETLTVSTAEGNEKSKSNMEEVEKIVDVFLYLVKTNKIKVKNINVMTQYNAQRSAVKEKLRYLGFDNVTTQTVVASQGGEWDYVIFSTVRSLPHYKIEREATPGWLKHSLGFITDQNQINVALTRARKGLIIIGNSKLLECDPIWRKLLHSYKEEKCFVYANQFPPPVRARGMQGGPLVPGTPGVLPNRV